MCTWAFLSIKKKNYPHSVFSLFWRENILVGPERKHLDTIIYFPSSLPNQIYSKKVFIRIFFPKFSIHLISPSNKHTLSKVVCHLAHCNYLYNPKPNKYLMWDSTILQSKIQYSINLGFST